MIDNKQLLFGSLQRLNAFPLVADSIFENIETLIQYTDSETLAYEGQLVSVLNDENIYMVVRGEDNKLHPVRVSLTVKAAEEIALRIATEKVTELRNELTPKIDENTQNISKNASDITSISTNIEDLKLTGSSHNSRIQNLETDVAKSKRDIIVLNTSMAEHINAYEGKITTLEISVEELKNTLLSKYYTREEVDTLINDKTHLPTKIVEKEEEITEPNIIYLLKPNPNADFYEQWIFDSKLGKIKIGSTINLQGYITSNQLETAVSIINGSISSLKASLNSHVTEANNKINTVVSSLTTLGSDLGNEIQRATKVEGEIREEITATKSYLESYTDTKIEIVNNKLTNLSERFENIESTISGITGVMMFVGAYPIAPEKAFIGTSKERDLKDGDVYVNTLTNKEYIYSNHSWVELGSASCECLPLTPLTENEINDLFNEINGECGGVEDPETVIQKIPLNKIESEFNEINGECGGVEDPEEAIEAIPSSTIFNLFSEINNC